MGPQRRKRLTPQPAPAKARGKSTRPPAMALAWAIDEYERDLRRNGIEPKTIRDYRKVLHLALGCWEQHLGRAPTLNDFTVRLGEAFTDWLRGRKKLTRWHGEDKEGKPLAEETIRTYLRALKAFSSWLAAPKQRYTEENRLHLLPLPKEPETYKLPLEKTEIQAFIDICDPTTTLGTRDLALLLLLLDGGLRASELTSLLVGHVNVDEGQIFIASGKGRKSRTVTVGADARRMLARYAFFRDAQAGTPAAPDAPFFRNLKGDALKYEALRKWLVRLKQRAGVTRTFLHLLRHTSAVQTLEVPGSDLFTLQAKLGHSDIATTRRYLRMTREQLSARQRTFSPIDHLGLDGLMRLESPEKSDGRLYHRRHKPVPAPTPKPRGRPRKERP
jgi:integrase/recombinase XerD